MLIQQDTAFPAMTPQQINAFQLLRFVHRSIDSHLERKIDPQSEIALSVQANAFMKQCQMTVQGYPMSLEVMMESMFEFSETYLNDVIEALAKPFFTSSHAQEPREKLLNKLLNHFEDYLDIEHGQQTALAHTLCHAAENWLRHVGRTCIGYIDMNKEAIEWCVPPLRLH
jgi:hypothetical protein